MTMAETTVAVDQVEPRTPWQATRASRMRNASVLSVAAIAALVVVLFTGVAGADGWAVTFFGLSLVIAVMKTSRVGAKERKNAIMQTVITSAAVVAFVPWLSIFGSVLLKGYAGLRPNFFTQDMRTTTPDDFLEFGGALHAIVGTLVMVVIATLITLPLGVLSGIYLTEVRGRITFLVRFVVQSMSGVPSIVAGLFIYAAWILAMGNQQSGLAGALALAVLFQIGRAHV